MWSSKCHKFKSTLMKRTHAAMRAAPGERAVIWMQEMWCFGGVAVKRKQTWNALEAMYSFSDMVRKYAADGKYQRSALK